MARRTSYQEERMLPELLPDKAITLLRQQRDKIDNLLKLKHDDPQVDKWNNFTEQVIIKAFGKPHNNLNDFHSAKIGGPIYMGMPDYKIQENFVNGYTALRTLLEGFIEQLEVFGGAIEGKGVEATKCISSKDIFIVHGHNEQAKKELALILHNLGFKPIILHEQANQGMTLIEKLEKHSDVGFAFILLTPDDTVIGSGPSVNEIRQEEGRARQNVVFEFGLFVGKLGRNRVCCLYTGDVKCPSDLDGLVYIPFENNIEEAELKIMRELKAAGYKIEV